MAGAAFPILIAHTPRAGRWNHVALLPGDLPSGTDAAAYLSTAESACGANYLAVAVDVEQPRTGRAGREVLVLIGVRVPDGQRLVALEVWLQERLVDLGAAVASFDWDAHAGGPAVLPALTEWRDVAVSTFDLRPHPTRTQTPLRDGAKPTARPLPRWLVLALACAGAALLATGLMRHRTTDSRPPVPPAMTNPPTADVR